MGDAQIKRSVDGADRLCVAAGLRRVSGAIAWIKEHFAEPLQIDALAKQVNMSPSALHHYFKAVAALSPVQYQKRLRLQEAVSFFPSRRARRP